MITKMLTIPNDILMNFLALVPNKNMDFWVKTNMNGSITYYLFMIKS